MRARCGVQRDGPSDDCRPDVLVDVRGRERLGVSGTTRASMIRRFRQGSNAKVLSPA